MSNISSTHNIEKYDPKNPLKAYDGQRLSKHSWKTPKEGENKGVKPESKAVSIPKLNPSIIGEIGLQNHLLGYLESVQDAMIKEMINNGATQVHNDQISASAMIEYLDAESNGGRLTKVEVENWFAQQIEEPLAMVLMEKLGVSATLSVNEEKQIQMIVNEFKGKVSGLAGGKTSYNPQIAEQVKKAILLAPEGDALKEKFINRLDKMISAKVEEINLLDAL